MWQAHHYGTASRNTHPIGTAAGVLVAVLAAIARLRRVARHLMDIGLLHGMKFAGEHAGRHEDGNQAKSHSDCARNQPAVSPSVAGCRPVSHCPTIYSISDVRTIPSTTVSLTPMLPI